MYKNTIVWLDALGNDVNFTGGMSWALKSMNNLSKFNSQNYCIRKQKNTRIDQKVIQVEWSSKKYSKKWSHIQFLIDNLFSILKNIRLIKILDAKVYISTSDFPADIIPIFIYRNILKKDVIWIKVIHHLIDKPSLSNFKSNRIFSFIYYIWQNIHTKIMISDQIWTHSEIMAKEISCKFEINDVHHGISGSVGLIEVTDENELLSFADTKKGTVKGKDLEIGFIGRPSENKGFIDLPLILDFLNRNFKYGGKVNLIGPINDKDITTSKWEKLPNWKINLFREVSDATLIKIVQQTDIFISPSRSEGWNFAMREIFLLGKPVFMYHLDIYKDVPYLENFCSTKFDIEQLANNIENYLENQDFFRDYIEKIQEVLNEQNWKKAIFNQINYLSQALNK